MLSHALTWDLNTDFKTQEIYLASLKSSWHHQLSTRRRAAFHTGAHLTDFCFFFHPFYCLSQLTVHLIFLVFSTPSLLSCSTPTQSIPLNSCIYQCLISDCHISPHVFCFQLLVYFCYPGPEPCHLDVNGEVPHLAFADVLICISSFSAVSWWARIPGNYSGEELRSNLLVAS